MNVYIHGFWKGRGNLEALTAGVAVIHWWKPSKLGGEISELWVRKSAEMRTRPTGALQQ